ncbi:uncharacterized protein P174DRAFT_102678 [Aspergillus novofumigatus IBT 16806]|uniref:Uncharacterized protein n=1 Tax=Aspergillus novofumigatus (strain IBT 16806) TaxID=1392255 RepID=A0A2I1CHS4_ASPN1|nr:uncharacterized protein P174DRAFT_102678 [Aspergillus novofumigatus IBT 16806]PKX97153.1 hypothetical protein P174DRAFT_102678 [Aspergillus novofumigatus IBT 16806]
MTPTRPLDPREVSPASRKFCPLTIFRYLLLLFSLLSFYSFVFSLALAFLRSIWMCPLSTPCPRVLVNENKSYPNNVGIRTRKDVVPPIIANSIIVVAVILSKTQFNNTVKSVGRVSSSKVLIMHATESSVMSMFIIRNISSNIYHDLFLSRKSKNIHRVLQF